MVPDWIKFSAALAVSLRKTNSSGKIRLVDSTENSEIAQEVNRVLGDGFRVVYGQ